jgi:hypothetical protein
MLKNSLSLMLVMLLVWTVPLAANSDPEKEKQFTAKVKTELTRLATGPDARVEVKLRNKRKLKGYIGEAAAEHFTLMDAKTGAATIIGAAILAVLFFIGEKCCSVKCPHHAVSILLLIGLGASNFD